MATNDQPVVLATTTGAVGGVGRHIVDLASGLLLMGRTVSLAVDNPSSSLADLAREQGLNVELTADSIKRGCIWHIHLHDTLERRALLMAMRARALGATVVITEHLPRTDASDPRLADRKPKPGASQAKRLFKIFQYSLADRIIAVSAGSREFLVRAYAMNSSRISLIENGVAPPAVAPGLVRASCNSAKMVAVGSLIRQKGFDSLVIASGLARTHWEIEVFGDGPHKHALQASADSLHGLGKVRFRGWSDSIAAEMAGFAALVVPSRWESSSYVALEAMGASRAVVGTYVDGLSDIVVHGETGLLVPPDDPVSLATAIDAVALDASLAHTMGEAGRRRVEARFSLAQMISSTVAAYTLAQERRISR